MNMEHYVKSEDTILSLTDNHDMRRAGVSVNVGVGCDSKDESCSLFEIYSELAPHQLRFPHKFRVRKICPHQFTYNIYNLPFPPAIIPFHLQTADIYYVVVFFVVII